MQRAHGGLNPPHGPASLGKRMTWRKYETSLLSNYVPAPNDGLTFIRKLEQEGAQQAAFRQGQKKKKKNVMLD